MGQPILIVLNVLQRLFVALLMGCGFAHTVWAAEPVVVIVASERTASYLEAVQALEEGLIRGGLSRADVQTMATTDPAFSPTAFTAKLVVALGLKASTLMASRESKTPLIATLLPRSGYEQIATLPERKAAGALSGIYVDQPFTRQLDLIRLTMPSARRIGVLWGADAPVQMPRLQNAATGRGFQLVAAQVGIGDSVFPALARVLEEADVLLAVANPQIYNNSSIQNILLASFRAKVPLVGFSPGYVQAGAVVSLYSTPAMIGRQTAVMARGVLQGKPLPLAPQYPHEFEVGVNPHVARSLGLTLDAAMLTERLRQLESAQ